MLNTFYHYYDRELANDVRMAYIDLLRRGNEDAQATQMLLDEYGAALDDEDEASVVWFSLADAQWDMGRLEAQVKQNALLHIDSLTAYYAAQADADKLIRELDAFKGKLMSPLPPKKPVKRYRLYHTDWQIGDVFAYSLDGVGAGYPDFQGMYMHFVVKGTISWYPGHTIPVVYVLRGVSAAPLSLDEIQAQDYRPQFYTPAAYRNHPELKRLYALGLMCTSARVIPKKKLQYLGRLENIRSIDGEEPHPYPIKWKRLDKYLIENYMAWEQASAVPPHERIDIRKGAKR